MHNYNKNYDSMDEIKQKKLAKYVLDTGTYSFGLFNDMQIDSVSFFIDNIKSKFGIFEKEIKEFVDLLKRLKIIDKIEYVEAKAINPELTGYAYQAEVSIPRLKNFIKSGSSDKENKNKKKEERKEKSSYSDYIKTIDDLLINIELKNRCLYIISTFGELKKGFNYSSSIIESEDRINFRNYEVILLLKELGLVKEIDLDGFYKQNSYKSIGSRRLEFTFEANKIIDFLNRANGKNAIVRKQALEHIAIHIGELASGTDLVNFLKDLGVPHSLIVYPNTKWRMLYDVLLYYASCGNEDRKMFFKIIEGASHPLMHRGDKTLAEETRKKLNSFLEYDNFSLDEMGILWEGWDDGNGLSYSNKDGVNFEDTSGSRSYVIFPEKISELYVYWNELIRLIKFYFENKNNQDEEINNLYFELIGKVESLLNKPGCGGLKDKYERPFRNIIGSEFEIQKRGLTQDALFVSIYSFLGEITEITLPERKDMQETKEKNAEFFTKITKYIKENTIIKSDELKKSEQGKELPIQKFELVNSVEVKGLEQGLKALSKTNKEEGKPKFPHKLPSGTKWEDVTIKFEDDEKIFIKVKRFEHYANYVEMGLIGRGNNPAPSEAWVFLRVLSMAKVTGEITITDPEAKDRYKKQKELLTNGLQSYFSIDYDPFFPYNASSEKTGKSYKTKITLIPPPEQPIKKDNQANKDSELKDFLEQEAPQIYDK